MFLFLLGTFFQGSRTCTSVSSLGKLQCSSASCLLPWDTWVHLMSTKLFPAHLWRGIVIFSFEYWSNTRWDNKLCQMERSEKHSLIYRTPDHISFLSPSSVQVPAVSHLLVTEDASSENGDKMPGGISHFTPLHKPRWFWRKSRWPQQVSGVEVWAWGKSADHCLQILGLSQTLPSLPPQTSRKEAPLPPSIAGISSAAIHNTSPPD